MNENEQNSELNDKSGNPFSLPGDYFGSFSKRMMHRIELADEIKEFKILSSIEKRLPLVTPENYFSGAEVKAELAACTNLAGLKKTNAFATPEHYFENSALAIKAKIGCAEELKAYPTLSGVEKTTSFVTPPAYFDVSAVAIKTDVELAEELKAYTALSSIEKINAFATPPAYFDNLSDEVRQKVAAGTDKHVFGKVIQLVFNRKTAYALAAMLVLSLGLYYFTNEKTVIVNNGDCQTLACLGKKDIKESQLLHLDEESLMEAVNPDQLSKNLKNNLAATPAEKASDKKEKEDYVIENTDVNDIVDGI